MQLEDVVTFWTMVMLWTQQCLLIKTHLLPEEDAVVRLKDYNSDVSLLSNVLAEKFLADVGEHQAFVERNQMRNRKQQQLKDFIEDPILLLGSVLLRYGEIAYPDLYVNLGDTNTFNQPASQKMIVEGKSFPPSFSLPQISESSYDTAATANQNQQHSDHQRRKRLLQKRHQNWQEKYEREFPLEIANSACPAITNWTRIEVSRDTKNEIVTVLQPPDPRASGTQFFYTTTCFNRAKAHLRQCANCCIAIDHMKYSSACLQKYSYVLAQIARGGQVMWDYIQVKSSCNCAIAPQL